ncbi:MAG: MarR family transcriptional regulator [Desulfobacterales bacterium]|nr:MarR family transcriptional regulator [Desulfobacterales bacterium]
MNNNDPSNLLKKQTENLVFLMHEIHKCFEVRKIHEHFRFKLPQAELTCLMAFESEQNLSFKGMAKKLDVAKSRVTKIVKSLLGKGLVRCISDPVDARVRLISLTPAGKKKIKEINTFKQDIHKQLLMQMAPEDRVQAIASLELIRSSMEIVKAQLK